MNFPGKNIGMGCHFLFQGIFLPQGLNLSLLPLRHQQSDPLPLVPPGKAHKQDECLHFPKQDQNFRSFASLSMSFFRNGWKKTQPQSSKEAVSSQVISSVSLLLGKWGPSLPLGDSSQMSICGTLAQRTATDQVLITTECGSRISSSPFEISASV